MRYRISLFIIWIMVVNAFVMALPIAPIMSFPEGNYSGGGDWLAQDGSVGSFLSFLDMESSSLTMASFELANLFVYKTSVTIDQNGFICAQMIDESDPHNPIFYPGYGNCGTHYCQVSIYLYNGTLWKALVFNSDNTISFFGSIKFDDETPHVQWQGTFNLLP